MSPVLASPLIWKSTKFLCCRENPILAPCWSCFIHLLSFAFVIIIIQNVLPQRILPFCLTVALKCLFFRSQRNNLILPPVNSCKKKEINTSLPWGWLFPETFCNTYGPFYLLIVSLLCLFALFSHTRSKYFMFCHFWIHLTFGWIVNLDISHIIFIPYIT